MLPLISVIIPVYNAERYLNRCINSVVEQTYNNIEIILVNDGSTDNSAKLCDDWLVKNERIKVFHKENGGAGDTRNYGVERATGEYIAFVDSDDVIDKFYLEHLYYILIENEADISCCDFIEFNGKNSVILDKLDFDYNVEVSSGYEICKRMISECSINLISPCCKLCKSEIIKKCKFPIGYICEDEATSCRFYYYSKKVVLSPLKLYGYYTNPSSVMNSHSPKRISDCIYVLNYRTQFFIKEKEHEMVSICINSLMHFLLYDSRPKHKFNRNIFCFLKKYWFNKDFSLNARKELIYYFLRFKLN